MKTKQHFFLANIALCSALILAALAPRAQGAASITPPGKLTYQGFLTDNNGNPLGAPPSSAGPINSTVIFRIFDASSGGHLVYSEQQIVTIDKGHFSVLLGEGGPVSGDTPAITISGDLYNVFNSATASDRYMEISVGTPPVTISPRLQFFAAPYALSARSATTLVDPTGAAVIIPTGAGLIVNTPVSASSLNLSGAATAGSFSGNGSGLTSLSAANITGTLDSSLIPTALNGTRSFEGELDIIRSSVLHFGVGLTKQGDAGKMGYGIFTPGALDIVGAGTDGNSRAIKFWNEGGATFAGGIFVRGGPIGPFNRNKNGYSFVGSGDSDSGMSSSSDGQVEFYSNGQERMRLHSNGFVGIGTTAPDVPLVVSGSVYYNLYDSPDGFTENNGMRSFGNGTYQFVGLRTDGWIATTAGFMAYSDARRKNVVSLSSPGGDLAAIQQLRVTDYRMKDTIKEGTGVRKGFIAQEVQKIIPEAVSTSSEFIPDLYVPASTFAFNGVKRTLSVTLPKVHELKAGDKVLLFADDSRLELDVSAVPSEHEFLVEKCDREPKRIFVYGKKVNDFLSLDYNRIFATGIGAIQELARRVELIEKREAHVAELERKASELDEMRSELVALKEKASRVDSLERDLAEVRGLVKELARSTGKVSPTAASSFQAVPVRISANLSR